MASAQSLTALPWAEPDTARMHARRRQDAALNRALALDDGDLARSVSPPQLGRTDEPGSCRVVRETRNPFPHPQPPGRAVAGNLAVPRRSTFLRVRRHGWR